MFAQLARLSVALAAVLLLAAPVFATSACPAGKYSSTGQTPCTQCPSGTFQPDAGQTSCRSAQAGWYAPGPGATSQFICQQGTFSTGGTGSCTICPAGSYCNGQGQTRPQLCPKGHYAPTPGLGQQCLECPRGTFVNYEGATACCTCCSGFYNDQTSQDHCFDCPIRGAFSPAGATSASQCANSGGGGLTSCTISGTTCPNTGGSFPSGYRRSVQRRKECPRGPQSCPVFGTRGAAHECVDVRRDLESCGGCVADDSPHGERSRGGGRDCSAIPHVDSVTCSSGACVIGRCAPGFSVSLDGARCVRALSVQAAYGRGQA